MTGRRPRLAGPSLLVPLLFALTLPTQAVRAEGFLDNLFGKSEDKAAPAAPAAPAEPDAAKKGAAKKDKAGDKPAKAAKATPDGQPPAKTASALEGATSEQIIERANAYFNGFQTLTGGFLQIGADGRKIGGKLYLAKPGRLRFAYDEPSPLEVVADGTSVAVRDRKLNTQDTYFINQTPLKFLLRDRIDLARDLDVTEIANDPGGIRVAMEDRSTLGGTSKIQLYFDAEMKTLSQWRITDPQGYLTTVQLANLQKGKPVDATLFFIDYGRPEDKAFREQMKRNEAQAQ